MLIQFLLVACALAACWVFIRWYTSRRFGYIDGVLLIDGQPAPDGSLLACEILYHEEADECDSSFTISVHNEYAETRDGGRFVFGPLPPSEVTIGRAYGRLERKRHLFGLLRLTGEMPGHQDREKRVAVKRGERSRVVLGEGCCSIQGRIVLPAALRSKIDWTRSEWIYLWGETQESQAPEGLNTATPTSWWKEFSESEEGLAWREAVSRHYHLKPDLEGNFTVSNVLPGRYLVRMISSSSSDEHDMAKKSYEGESAPFDVAEASCAEGALAFDLGDVPMKVRKRGAILDSSGHARA